MLCDCMLVLWYKEWLLAYCSAALVVDGIVENEESMKSRKYVRREEEFYERSDYRILLVKQSEACWSCAHLVRVK